MAATALKGHAYRPGTLCEGVPRDGARRVLPKPEGSLPAIMPDDRDGWEPFSGQLSPVPRRGAWEDPTICSCFNSSRNRLFRRAEVARTPVTAPAPRR
jgi:hypothetical protein